MGEQVDPHHLAAFFYRAYAQKNLRRYDLARQDYEEVLKRVPGHYEARLCLAQICQLTGKMTEAVDHLNRLVELAPDVARHVMRTMQNGTVNDFLVVVKAVSGGKELNSKGESRPDGRRGGNRGRRPGGNRSKGRVVRK